MEVQKLRQEIVKKLPKLSNLNKNAFKHWKCLWNVSNVYCGAYSCKVRASTLLKMYSITKNLLRTSRNWKCNFSNKIMTDKSCSFIKNENPLLLRIAIWLKVKGVFQRILSNFKFQSFENRLHQRGFTKKISKFHILLFVHVRTFISKHRIKLIGCVSVSASWHLPAIQTTYVQ